MLTTFLRDSNGQPEDGRGNGFDCDCQSYTDKNGVVTTICMTRRVPRRPQASKPQKPEVR